MINIAQQKHWRIELCHGEQGSRGGMSLRCLLHCAHRIQEAENDELILELTSLSRPLVVPNLSPWDATIDPQLKWIYLLSSPNLESPLWVYPEAGLVGDPRSCQTVNQYLPTHMSFILLA